VRIVVDTNIFVSAALKDRSLPAIAARQATQHGVLLKSTVTARPYLAPLISRASREWLTTTLAAAELVTITEHIVACRDPTDDKFLKLAVSGCANLILTGDNDLLVLDPFRGIPIVAPSIFLQRAAP
jgi:uncharacterized protein